MNSINFIVGGVGGQGVLLASDVIAELGIAAGHDVKKSDVHGMAQRGGAVVSHVRWGETVYSPLVELGQADFVIAFELIESLRWLKYLAPGGVVIVNHQQIPPASTVWGDDIYPAPESVLETLSGVAGGVFYIEGTRLAAELGNLRAMNSVMLGALSTRLDIAEDLWLRVLLDKVPQKYMELNRGAFQAGAKMAADQVAAV